MVMSPDLVTQTDAAKALGVTQSAISRLVKRGKLPAIDGRIHLPTARAVLAQNLDPSRSKILKQGIERRELQMETVEHGTPVVDYTAAKAIREHYEGLRAKLEYERRCGELVERAAVERAAAHIGRMTRDTLLSIPARVASDLATVSDARLLEERLAGEIRKVLDDIAKTAAQDVGRVLT